MRTRRSLSQEGLAAACGLHRTYLGGIERGERNPSYANILRIADALGLEASALLAEAERIGGRRLVAALGRRPRA